MGGVGPLWEVRDVSKSFPGVRALDGVSLTLHEGEIAALVGENGSGKTTLAKCLAGVHQPDHGELHYRGERVELRDPAAARDLGVAVFYQESSLVPSLTVAENIFLGRLPRRGPIVDWARARRDAALALEGLSVSIDAGRPVSDLSVAEQQLVEIAKALSGRMTLLILDEPTAALGPEEIGRLHEVIRLLARQGTSMLYISHRLDEVFGVADRIAVLRDGRLVGEAPKNQTSVREVVRMMIGSDMEEHFVRDRPELGRTRLEVRNLRTRYVRDVSFSLAAGEILGLGGVIGSGRTAIARALFGIDPIFEGEVRIDGRPIRLRSPDQAIAAGIALVPEDRKADGLFFNFPGPPNVSIANLAAVKRGPVLSLARERRSTGALMDHLRVDRRAGEVSVRYLSGGNQQKIVLSRWLFSEARVLILDEPTQGIDIGAKYEVYGVMNELTTRGISILLISSDYPELLTISDRVAVVRQGQIVHMAPQGSLAEHELVEMAATDLARGA
jgi:ribose transport system ATP-binding protein